VGAKSKSREKWAATSKRLRSTDLDQTLFNAFTVTPKCRSRHWEFILSLRRREFNLSHMRNPLGKNITN